MGDFIIEKPRKLKKSKIKKGKSGSTDAPKRQKSKNGSKPSSKHSKATLYKKKFVDDTFVEGMRDTKSLFLNQITQQQNSVAETYNRIRRLSQEIEYERKRRGLNSLDPFPCPKDYDPQRPRKRNRKVSANLNYMLSEINVDAKKQECHRQGENRFCIAELPNKKASISFKICSDPNVKQSNLDLLKSTASEKELHVINFDSEGNSTYVKSKNSEKDYSDDPSKEMLNGRSTQNFEGDEERLQCEKKWSWLDAVNWVPPSYRQPKDSSVKKLQNEAVKFEQKYSWQNEDHWVPPHLKKNDRRNKCEIKYSWQIVGMAVQTSSTLMDSFLKEQTELPRSVQKKYSWQINGKHTQVKLVDENGKPCEDEDYWEGVLVVGRNKDWQIKRESVNQSLSTVNASIQTQSVVGKLAIPLRPKYTWEKIISPILQNHEEPKTAGGPIDAFKDKSLERIEQLVDVPVS